MSIPLCVEGGNGFLDGSVERAWIGKSPVGEVMGFKVPPDRLDVIEFRRIFRQPFDSQPMGAGCERGLCGLAHMDGAVIEHHDNWFASMARPGAVEPIELVQKSDEIGAAFGAGGG